MEGRVVVGSEMSGRVFAEAATVRSALCNNLLVPPAAPATIGTGAAAELREAMARFSSGELHRDRRATVEAAIAELQAKPISEIARSAVNRRLVGIEIDACIELGFVVPTETIGVALELASDSMDELVAEVGLMVEVTGRGETANSGHDLAVERLASRLDDHAGDTVALLSILYQNFDATAALFAAKVVAHFSDNERRSALAKTVRSAAATTTVGEDRIEAGETIALSLDSLELEFGAGPHQCPGEQLAKQIVDGMLLALRDSRYQLVLDQVEMNREGRPIRLPLATTA